MGVLVYEKHNLGLTKTPTTTPSQYQLVVSLSWMPYFTHSLILDVRFQELGGIHPQSSANLYQIESSTPIGYVIIRNDSIVNTCHEELTGSYSYAPSTFQSSHIKYGGQSIHVALDWYHVMLNFIFPLDQQSHNKHTCYEVNNLINRSF